MEKLIEFYNRVRDTSVRICTPLQTEDYVVQPIPDVSPPKWHLGHTTWFFETFVLLSHFRDYRPYNDKYSFVFNSYYETLGTRIIRTDRGNLSRPSVSEIYAYREHVDRHMRELLAEEETLSPELIALLILGLNHEQQHQELLLSDIKYILGHNPLFPAYLEKPFELTPTPEMGPQGAEWIKIPEGNYGIGNEGEGFCFDNELGRHRVQLGAYEMASRLVSQGEFLEFMQDGGYENFKYWYAEGWDWVKVHKAKAPLYWHQIDGIWMQYTLAGLNEVDPDEAVQHVNFYEVSAYAAWKAEKGAACRLPTEAEWEVASSLFDWGYCWEWTGSAYLPYPGFKQASGAVGEYNGKFMINQMVLRGASHATPQGHSRPTYRNFFHPDKQWQFTGIRLARSPH